MLQYCREAGEVQLAVDRAYSAGEPIRAWCGPQPNRRLLLNYGIVTDDNPYDKCARPPPPPWGPWKSTLCANALCMLPLWPHAPIPVQGRPPFHS
jgi:hypothetical protein